MIDFPIIDTHLHLWDINYLKYPWLENIPKLNRPFLLDEYHKASKEFNIEKIVFMQAECSPDQYVQEVEWVTEMAKADPGLEGIIAWAPLEKGEKVRPEIESLNSNRLVKGIRRIIQFEPDLEFCLNPEFIKGVNILSDYDLTFDICISHIHNENILKFISECQHVPMILDHIGKPDIKNGILDPWSDEISEMSSFPNVCCKLSGMATEADHQNWTIDDLRPYLLHVLACFGYDRLIFGSDWPVSTQASDLVTTISTFITILRGAGATREDLMKVFYQNARNFYGL